MGGLLFALGAVLLAGGGSAAFLAKAAKEIRREEAQEARERERRSELLQSRVGQIVTFLNNRDGSIMTEGVVTLVDDESAYLDTRVYTDENGVRQSASSDAIISRKDIKAVDLGADVVPFDEEGNNIWEGE